MKKIYAVLVAGLLMTGLYGCSTVEGVGKDIQKGGSAIENAAEDAQS
jgi:entericidin B